MEFETIKKKKQNCITSDRFSNRKVILKTLKTNHAEHIRVTHEFTRVTHETTKFNLTK